MPLPGILVAGGTGALGAAVVRALLEAGHPVTATWVVEHERDRTHDELSGVGELALHQADLTDPDAARAAVGSVPDLGGVVDLVGGYAGGPLVHETDPDEFDRMLRLNLRPAFLLARAALPRLVERGGGPFVAVSARAAVR